MSTYEVWNLALSGLIALLTAAGLGGLMLQVRHATLLQRRDHQRQREQATVELYATTLEKLVAWREHIPNDRDWRAVRQALEGGDLTDGEVAQYLDYIELLATGVNGNIYDFETIYVLMGPRLIQTYWSYEEWIEQRRSRFRSSTLYSEWERLVADLTERKRNDPSRGGSDEIDSWDRPPRPTDDASAAG